LRCAPRGIRTPNRQIRSLVLYVDLVGSRRIWPAHVAGLVDLDGSRQVPSDRLDDQADDQARRAVRRTEWIEHKILCLVLQPQAEAQDPQMIVARGEVNDPRW
jgi:hypothetical protein